MHWTAVPVTSHSQDSQEFDVDSWKLFTLEYFVACFESRAIKRQKQQGYNPSEFKGLMKDNNKIMKALSLVYLIAIVYFEMINHVKEIFPEILPFVSFSCEFFFFSIFVWILSQ